jgi:ribulose 1,5-bisphosphate synthetase/thiazole synthase
LFSDFAHQQIAFPLDMQATEQHQTHDENTRQDEKTGYFPVVIIGAGASGLAMGCQLKRKLGFDQFQIFERQSSIGGK